MQPLGGAPNRSVCKRSHTARHDGIVARLAAVFRATLARSPWKESADPRHGGCIRLRHHRSYTRRLPICGEPLTRSEADKFPPPPALLPIPSRSSVVSAARRQEVVHDEISNINAESLTGRKVEREVYPSEQAALRCLLRSSLKLVNERSSPGMTSDVTLKSKLSL